MLNYILGFFGKNIFLDAFFIFLFFCFIGIIVDLLLIKFFLKITAKTKTNIDDKLVLIFKKPIFISFLLIGLYFSFKTLNLSASILTIIIINIIATLGLLLWLRVSFKILKIFMNEIFPVLTKKTKTNLDNEILPLVKNIAKLVIIFIFIYLLFLIWKIDITPLLAAGGILGFAIAFASQNTISHIFGGLSVYADKPFKVGDRIKLDSGETGDVISIGLRSTRIKTFDETMIIIPNDTIANSKIINYNQPKTNIKVKISIGVEYGTDIDLVKKTLLKCAKKVDIVLDKPQPSVFFVNHGDSSLDFLLITWVESPYMQFRAKDKLNTQINKEFKKQGIEIPFPTRTIYNRKDD